MGRFISVIVMVEGFYVISMFVVSLSDLLSFSKGELKSFDFLNNLYIKEQMMKKKHRGKNPKKLHQGNEEVQELIENAEEVFDYIKNLIKI